MFVLKNQPLALTVFLFIASHENPLTARPLTAVEPHAAAADYEGLAPPNNLKPFFVTDWPV